MEAKDLMRVSELAPLLGLTSGRVYQLIAEGVIPATRIGRAVRIPKPALDAWLQRCTADANRSAREAAGKRVMRRPEPSSGADRAVIEAAQGMVTDHPFGWRGSATELLQLLADYRPSGERLRAEWPESGRSLSMALRRLITHLAQAGVRVSIGHRGHRGKRIVSICEAVETAGSSRSSVSSRRGSEKPAASKGKGSSRTCADDGDGSGYTGSLSIPLDEYEMFMARRSAAQVQSKDSSSNK